MVGHELDACHAPLRNGPPSPGADHPVSCLNEGLNFLLPELREGLGGEGKLPACSVLRQVLLSAKGTPPQPSPFEGEGDDGRSTAEVIRHVRNHDAGVEEQGALDPQARLVVQQLLPPVG